MTFNNIYLLNGLKLFKDYHIIQNWKKKKREGAKAKITYVYEECVNSLVPVIYDVILLKNI